MLDFLLVCLLLSVVMRIGQCRPKMKVCINAHGSMEMHFLLQKLVWLELKDCGGQWKTAGRNY